MITTFFSEEECGRGVGVFRNNIQRRTFRAKTVHHLIFVNNIVLRFNMWRRKIDLVSFFLENILYQALSFLRLTMPIENLRDRMDARLEVYNLSRDILCRNIEN